MPCQGLDVNDLLLPVTNERARVNINRTPHTNRGGTLAKYHEFCYSEGACTVILMGVLRFLLGSDTGLGMLRRALNKA